ncbi:hypothetical protein [Maritimibacter fusiformis]|uniref:hypothetical protein n=1 Tax=Maritimibacter fusiformis TaxID=2603819 RepID=UPI001651B5CB|nr:hypothetical protein [Maritimibacter fusiformis]
MNAIELDFGKLPLLPFPRHGKLGEGLGEADAFPLNGLADLGAIGASAIRARNLLNVGFDTARFGVVHAATI